MTEPKTSDTLASFAEWRGAVKTALDFIQVSLKRLETEDLEQWETIEQVRGMMDKHRDRCDQLSREKAVKGDLDAAKGSLDAIKDELAKKASVDDLSALKTEVGNQAKTQIKQGVTMVFYGLIGGALFSLLLALFNHFIRTAGS